MKKFLISLSSIFLGFSLISSAATVDNPPNPGPTGGVEEITINLGTCLNPYIITCRRYQECNESTGWVWAWTKWLDWRCEGTHPGGSLLMSGGMRYFTWSDDFKTSADPSGCAPCGGAQSGSAKGRLPELAISRFFEPLSYNRENLTFGSVHGLKTYDQRFHFAAGQTNLEIDDFGSVIAKRVLNFNPALQCWTDNGVDQGPAGVYLFNAAGLPITTAATRNTAHTGVRLNHDGSTVHFQILWNANGSGIARPVAFLDTHGNAVEIEYTDAQPTFGTPVNDSLPYFRKTIIRDAYGREAQFTYTKLFNKYVATRIDLPNGGHITYNYVWNGGVQLSKVTHADGTESLWSKVVNTTTKLDEWTLIDAKSDPGHRRKRIFFSTNQGYDVNGNLISTTRNRVRRAQNGAGEFVWDSRYTGNLQDRYIYEGGNSVSKHTFYNNGKGLGKSERVTNDLWKGNFHQGDVSTWTTETKIAVRQNNSRHSPVSDKDSRNRVMNFTRDPLSDEITSGLNEDGTTNSGTRNQFLQPLVTTDRLGRITTNTYSPLGDLLTKTNATGTSDETTKTYLYNTRGQVIEARDALYDANFPELHNTRYEYNANGFLVKRIDSADVAGGTRPESLFAYDSAGRLTTSTDPAGRVVTYAYDAENRIVSTTYADTSTELIEYGTGLEANLIKKTTDRNGYETTYQYDAADRVIETVTAANTDHPIVETCTYLVGTRLKETCTINGSKTTYTFDHRNRVIATTVHPTEDTSLTNSTEIDEIDRTRSTTDAYGRKTFYLYDQNDNVTRTVTETVPGAINAPAFTKGASQTSANFNYTLTDKDGNTLATNPNNDKRTHVVTYTDPRDLFLKNLTRDLTANAKYLITDFITDAEGQTLISTDARGINTWMQYDKLGRNTLTIIAVGTPEEIRSSNSYDDNSNLVETKSPRHFSENINAIDTFAYNGRNLKSSHTTAPNSPEEATQSWTYNLDGTANEHTDFRGNIAKQIWHACCARLQASIDRDGQSTTIYNTDHKGQPIHSATVGTLSPSSANYPWHNPADANTLRETTTRFDGRGRPTHTTTWLNPLGSISEACCAGAGSGILPIAGLEGVSSTFGLTTSYQYDDNLTDGLGLDATYATQLAQLNLTFGPKATGSAAAVTNPAGETSVQIQDGIGRTVMTINPEGHTATMAYDEVESAVGVPPTGITIPGALLVITSTDANGNSQSSYSDAAGRTILAEDSEGNLSGAAYDANSNTILTADPNGLGQTCIYDALNRQTNCADKQEQAENTSRLTTYNAASQVITSTNAEGETTTSIFDVRNRLLSSTDANNINTAYAYDANNNLISLTDGENHTRLWFYEERNLNRTKAYPDGNQNNDFYSQNFDALGRVKIKVDQAGTTVTMIYDLAGRLTEKQYHTGATPASDPAQTVVITQGPTLESTDTFSYDAASRIIETVKGRHGITTGHTYAQDSTPLTETVEADNRTYTMSRTYDNGNRPLTHTFPDGKSTTWAYNNRNLVTNVSYEGEAVLTQTHDAAYRLTNQTLGNGLTRTINYGRQDNLRTSDQTFDGVQSLDDLAFSYTYAADKQITAETIIGDAVQNTSFTAQYDAGNRLTAWETPPASPSTSAQTWNYDNSGNWNSTTKTIASNTTTENRTHSASDQITQIAGNAAVHDLKGNLTEYEINSKQYNVDYDLENRIIKVDVNNSDVEYRYDALGRQIIRKEGSTQTTLLWWGNSECAEYEHNAGQSTIQNDIMSHPTMLNAVIARAVDGSKFDLEWYHKNYLDHVYAVSDDSGNLNEHYRYTAFGEATIYNGTGSIQTSSQINNSILWNTRRLDSVSGYYLYKYRHYDPELGRWPSRDPIEENGGVNLYAFVGNNGINYWDYLGFCEEGELYIDGFKITLESALDNAITIDDPEGVLFRFLMDRLNDLGEHGFDTWVSARVKAVKDKLKGIWGKFKNAKLANEFLSSAGFIVNSITVELTFKCCETYSIVCEETGGKTVGTRLGALQTDTAEADGLLFYMRDPEGIQNMTDKMMELMIEVTMKALKKCEQ